MILEQTPKKDIHNLPWVERYRPATLENQISHDSIISTIKKFIEKDCLPHLQFYGPPGTGKTSTMVATAKNMFGSRYKMSVLELNASDERGINTVRYLIKTFCETRSPFDTKDSKKIVILDEADSMTKEAQNALRRVIEKYSRTVRFCQICNYVSKIIPALVSRCTRFKFKKIPYNDAIVRVKEICDLENIKITEEAMLDICTICQGDMRKIVNMLQSIHITLKSGGTDTDNNEEIGRNYIFKMTGYPHPEEIDNIFNILMNDDVMVAYARIKKISSLKGISLISIINEVTQRVLSLELPGNTAVNIIQRLAEIEYRLSISCSEEIQLGSQVSAFTESRIKSI